MGLLLTQVFKVMVGRLRPNFLARCQPLVDAATPFTLANVTAALQPDGALQLPCGNDDGDAVKEGRLAFVSGGCSGGVAAPCPANQARPGCSHAVLPAVQRRAVLPSLGWRPPCAPAPLCPSPSFYPAGHTSLCFNLAVYASGYLLWVWHWRHPAPPRRLSFGQEFRADLLNVLAKTWMLAMLCFAWGVGVSR